MRDAIDMEVAGIPSVAIIHKTMMVAADSMRRLSGMPEYPFLMVTQPESPLAKWEAEDLRRIVKTLAPEVIAQLTRRDAK